MVKRIDIGKKAKPPAKGIVKAKTQAKTQAKPKATPRVKGTGSGSGSVDKVTGLTARMEEFCRLVAYNPDMSNSDAYRACYDTSRMKPESIHRLCWQLLQNVKIVSRIITLRKERADRVELNADFVLLRMKEVDQLDVLDILDPNGGVLPLREWPKQWRTLISEIELTEVKITDSEGNPIDNGGNPLWVLRKVKWPDKVKNLDMIGKHINVMAWNEKLSIVGAGGGAIETVSRIERVLVDTQQ